MATINKKVRKARGKRGGRGNGKKQRGKGTQGGHGLAGLNKWKMGTLLKYAPDHFGSWGIARRTRHQQGINLYQISQKLNLFEDKGALKEGVLDLTSTKYDKVLGVGDVPKGIKKIVAHAVSDKAKTKLKEANIEIIIG